jgi:RHS repeat-associated protein
MQFNSKKTIYFVFVWLLSAMCFGKASAANDPVHTQPLLGSAGMVQPGQVSEVTDVEYFAPLSPIEQTFVVKNLVSVGIEEESKYYIQSDFSAVVKLHIMKYNQSNQLLEEFDKDFAVNYKKADGEKYNAIVYLPFENAYRVKVRVEGITKDVAWDVSKVLRVDNTLTATRDYVFNCTAPIANFAVSYYAADDELTAAWNDPHCGQTEYDLEWAWIDESAIADYQNTNGQWVPEKIFFNNATRVTISQPNYNIPLLYDGEGRLFVRVRPAQIKHNGQRLEGQWTWQNGGSAVYHSFNGHEGGLNWQATTSYAEEGKRKSVVEYFDGTLRNRQTVTKDNSTGTTIVAESFYDYQGRPVVQVLPAPTLSTIIKYAENFNRSINDAVGYPKWAYDRLQPGASVCGNPAQAFTTATGTAQYYSANNPKVNDGFNKYIPSATGTNPNEGYAFVEARFAPDGRVAAQSGVGPTHQLGSGHETKHLYETPSQAELDALFGTDAGYASHYFKTFVKDPNGQYSVSYTDMQGRTVATALAGDAPAQLTALPSLNTKNFTKELLDDETNRVIGRSIVSSKPLVVPKAGLYKFDYTLSPDQLKLLNCNGQDICYDCLYKLKFTVTSDCNNVPGFTEYVDSSYNFTLGQYLNQCRIDGKSPGFNKHFELTLPEGAYTVTKTLTLSTEAQNAYRDVFLANDTCKTLLQFFNNEYQVMLANANCAITCASCTTAIGNNFNDFKQKFLQQSGMTEPLQPELLTQLTAAYNDALANCNRICNPNNNDGLDAVRAIRQTMLIDVTPPYGQYAKPGQANMPFNIFNAESNANEVFGGASPDYRNPIQHTPGSAPLLGNYYNEFGQIDNPAGLSGLTPQQFADQFKTPWAEQLLPHHPEYCKLKVTLEDLPTTYQFEATLTNTNTWSAAGAAGYINNLINLDPFFNGPGLAHKTAMQQKMAIYASVGSGAACPGFSLNASMWQLAQASVFCRNLPTTGCAASQQNQCLLGYNANPAVVPATGCATDWDMAWKNFRTLYLTERKKLIAAYLRGRCGAISDASITGVSGTQYRLRFIDYQNINYANLDAGDLAGFFNEVGSGSGNAYGTGQALAADLYANTCKGYAATWIAQLQQCPNIGTISPADSIWLTDRLVKICTDGSDEYHYLGSSSVKPGNPGYVNPSGSNPPAFTEFPQVIQQYLINKGIAVSSLCHPYLITQPKPYDKQPAPTQQLVIAKPSDCECQRLTALQTEYQQAGFSGNFSAYLKYRHGTTISQGALDTLTALCNGSYTCNFLPAPIVLPPALQCRGTAGNPKTCIDCAEYQQLKTGFAQTFGQQAPVADPQTQAAIDLNMAFQQYANYKTGFSKTWAEYLAFEAACAQQPIPCASLNATLALFQQSTVYQQNPTGDNCRQAFVQFFNSAYGTNYTFQEWMEIFQQSCGSQPNVCNVVLSCELLNNLITQFYNTYGVQVYKQKNCVGLFTAFVNAALGSNYTYAEIDGLYREVCGTACPLDVCSFPNCFLLTRAYNQFVANANGQPWLLIDCQGTFISFFNEYFGLYSTTSDGWGWDAIWEAYHNCFAQGCGPNLDNLCQQQGADCETLKRILDLFYGTYGHDIGAIKNCKQVFAEFFNAQMGTSYSYAELNEMYYATCGFYLDFKCEGSVEMEMVAYRAGLSVGYQPPLLCGLNDPIFNPQPVDDNPCKELTAIAWNAAIEKWELYKDSLRNVFDTAWQNKCLGAKSLERFTVNYNVSEYHYTLYYYDQADNLVQTVPPAGVDARHGDAAFLAGVEQRRLNVKNGGAESANQLVPSHTLVTTYRYNTLGQVVAQKTPDAGKSEFWYDRLGRLAISQNAKQAIPVNYGTGTAVKYTYTLYDDLGRVTEVGQKPQQANSMSQTVSRNKTALQNWLNALGMPKEEITLTRYDLSYHEGNNFLGTPPQPVLVQRNLRNRVSYAMVYDTEPAAGVLGTHRAATYYTYDIHGNVDTLLQDYNSGAMQLAGNRFKKMVYQYDLISGKVNTVAYQPGLKDQFYHRYTYDAENRITDVETSHDGLIWEKDARYSYYKHGQLARTIIGQQQVQGIDYATTLQGGIKGVNSTAINNPGAGATVFDMGQDGVSGGALPNQVAVDAFGYSLNYFSGDYKPINTGAIPFMGNALNLTNAASVATAKPLYNGNVASMLVNIPKLGDVQLYGYQYDQLNRIKGMDAFKGFNNATNNWVTTPQAMTAYQERVSYDANGNILSYQRNGNSLRVQMDDMTYSYKPGTNQLDKVVDAAPDAAASEYDKYNDIKQGQGNGNYQYDAIGNLVSDVSEGISNITWTMYGKIATITKSNGISIAYTYDAAGNRISKTINGKQTWYVRDAGGNVMSVYAKEVTVNSGHLTQGEVFIYGVNRVGVFNMNRNVESLTGTPAYIFIRGNKYFELANHLGNVLVTVNDKKTGIDTDNNGIIDYYTASVVSANDYYPFGMAMPSRKFIIGGSQYRFGFNGKEKDEDIALENYNLGARIYDARIGRLLSTDPREAEYAWQSTYVYYKNSPLAIIDIDGKGGGGPPETILYHTTKSVESAQNIVQNGFNANIFGKYSTYNWFSITPVDPGAGVRVAGSGGPIIQVSGLDTRNVDIITKAQTDSWRAQAIKKLGYTNTSFEALASGTKQEVKLYKELTNKIRGMVYSSIGQYMDRMKQAGYYLEMDKTYAFTDAAANSAKRTITGISGQGAKTVIDNTLRHAREGEAAKANSRFSGAKSFLKWGGRLLLAVAIAKDVYDIYQAEDKTREVIKKVSFWAGFAGGAATAGGGAAACGIDFGGPLGWLAHGAIALGGGLVGGFTAETIVTKVYDYYFHK